MNVYILIICDNIYISIMKLYVLYIRLSKLKQNIYGLNLLLFATFFITIILNVFIFFRDFINLVLFPLYYPITMLCHTNGVATAIIKLMLLHICVTKPLAAIRRKEIFIYTYTYFINMYRNILYIPYSNRCNNSQVNS